MGASYSATKLKVQLKSATARMGMQTNKMNNAIRIDSRAIASLLQQKKDESARIKVEGLIHQRNLITVMETLQLMCDLLATRIAIITNSTAIPPDLEESIATIVYASQRVEVDELTTIAHILAGKYGEKALRQHVDDSLHRVNPRVVEKLQVRAPDFALVISTMQDIAGQYSVEWKPDLSVLDSGMRDGNPERLGSIAGGPKSGEGGEYKEEDLHALPTAGKGAQQPGAAGGDGGAAAGAGGGGMAVGAAAAAAAAGKGERKGEDDTKAAGTTTRPPKSVSMPEGTSTSLPARPGAGSPPPPAFSPVSPPAAGAVPPSFVPPPTYPGTLNIILLQARDVPAQSSSPHRTLIKISEPSSPAWHWISKPAVPSSSANVLLFPPTQHCPLSVSSPGMLVVVEVVHELPNGGEEVVGGLSIEAEQMRRSADGTWYTVFSSHSHQPRGQVLLASQYMPLQVGIGEGAGEEPVYHSMAAGAVGADHRRDSEPPAYSDGGSPVVRLGIEGEREGELGAPLVSTEGEQARTAPGGPGTRSR